jgi:hypothetical protein
MTKNYSSPLFTFFIFSFEHFSFQFVGIAFTKTPFSTFFTSQNKTLFNTGLERQSQFTMKVFAFAGGSISRASLCVWNSGRCKLQISDTAFQSAKDAAELFARAVWRCMRADNKNANREQ